MLLPHPKRLPSPLLAGLGLFCLIMLAGLFGGRVGALFNARTTNPASTVANAVLSAPVLAVPTVTGTGVSGQISLAWSPPAGSLATQWTVWRGSGPCATTSFTSIATVSSSSYSDPVGVVGTYCYQVTGARTNWTSPASNSQPATVTPTLPALVQSATAVTSSAGTSISATFASTPAGGRLLIVVVGGTGGVLINQPAGWSTAVTSTVGAPSLAIFYKVAGGSESRTVTATVLTSSQLGLQLYEYSGVATSNPLDQAAQASGSSSAPASPSVTTTQPIELLFMAEALNSNTSISSWSNGFLERNDLVNTGSASQRGQYSAADRMVQSVGTYSSTATAGANAPWRSQIATFKAAP